MTASKLSSTHRRRSVRKGVLRNFAKFPRKHLYQSLFIKKETLAQVFPVNFATFLRTPFSQNTSGRLLLKIKLLLIHNSEKTTPIYLSNCLTWNTRSSRLDVFCEKGVLKNFVKITEKHLCQSLFLNKVAGVSPATLLKKRPWHRCFPVNFAKYLRTLFFTEHLRWLPLKYEKPLLFTLCLHFPLNFRRRHW